MPGVVPQGALLAVLARARELAQLIAMLHEENVHVGRENTSSLCASKCHGREG